MSLSSSPSILNSPDFHPVRIPTEDPVVSKSSVQLSKTDEKTQKVAIQQIVESKSTVLSELEARQRELERRRYCLVGTAGGVVCLAVGGAIGWILYLWSQQDCKFCF